MDRHRLELWTARLWAGCANHCANDPDRNSRIWTDDLLIPNQALYRTTPYPVTAYRRLHHIFRAMHHTLMGFSVLSWAPIPSTPLFLITPSSSSRARFIGGRNIRGIYPLFALEGFEPSSSQVILYHWDTRQTIMWKEGYTNVTGRVRVAEPSRQ